MSEKFDPDLASSPRRRRHSKSQGDPIRRCDNRSTASKLDIAENPDCAQIQSERVEVDPDFDQIQIERVDPC